MSDGSVGTTPEQPRSMFIGEHTVIPVAASVGSTDTPTPTLDLDAIEQRANASTEGPWCADPIEDRDGWFVHSAAEPLFPIVAVDERGSQSEPDAAFIAAARTDVPALVAEVRRLTQDNQQWKRISEDAARAVDIAPAVARTEIAGLRAKIADEIFAYARDMKSQAARDILNGCAARVARGGDTTDER